MKIGRYILLGLAGGGVLFALHPKPAPPKLADRPAAVYEILTPEKFAEGVKLQRQIERTSSYAEDAELAGRVAYFATEGWRLGYIEGNKAGLEACTGGTHAPR